DRDAGHFAHQPFGQVPWLTDGELSIFESGAILLHLGTLSDTLMPADPRSRSDAIQWVFAALNSMEMATVPWSLFKFFGDTGDTWGPKFFDEWVNARLGHLEPVFANGGWLAGSFSVADILMADVLRLVDRFDGLASYPACRAYVARATARPAFKKAYADQMAHFAAADRNEA
ncbi:MAG: glutathione S-transferase family protein, partial [Gammaproteobacteria bacterium]